MSNDLKLRLVQTIVDSKPERQFSILSSLGYRLITSKQLDELLLKICNGVRIRESKKTKYDYLLGWINKQLV